VNTASKLLRKALISKITSINLTAFKIIYNNHQNSIELSIDGKKLKQEIIISES
jgi:hypothetical protein